jgi:hypothetical protein
MFFGASKLVLVVQHWNNIGTHWWRLELCRLDFFLSYRLPNARYASFLAYFIILPCWKYHTESRQRSIDCSKWKFWKRVLLNNTSERHDSYQITSSHSIWLEAPSRLSSTLCIKINSTIVPGVSYNESVMVSHVGLLKKGATGSEKKQRQQLHQSIQTSSKPASRNRIVQAARKYRLHFLHSLCVIWPMFRIGILY